MGFFSSLGRGLIGAATGLASGGPIGAVAGGLAGLASSGGNTTSGTSSQSTRGTREVVQRGLTDQERQFQDAAYASAAANQALTPEQAAELRRQEYERLYGAAEGAVNRSYKQSAGAGYAADARRGLAGSYGAGAREDARQGDRAFTLSQASAQAEGQAMDAVLAQEANRRANTAAAIQKLNAMWQNILNTSKVVTTGSGAGSSTSTAPDNFLSTAASGIGAAIADDSSWLNNYLNKKSSVVSGPIQNAGPLQGPSLLGSPLNS